MDFRLTRQVDKRHGRLEIRTITMRRALAHQLISLYMLLIGFACAIFNIVYFCTFIPFRGTE